MSVLFVLVHSKLIPLGSFWLISWWMQAWQLLFWSPVTSLVCSAPKMLQKLSSDGTGHLQALIPEVFSSNFNMVTLTITPRNFWFFPPNESYILTTWIQELELKSWKTCPKRWCCTNIGAFCNTCVEKGSPKMLKPVSISHWQLGREKSF